MSVPSRQSSPSKDATSLSKDSELQRMREVCQKLALEKNALFVKHQTALDDQNALKVLHAQKMEMMLTSLNHLLRSTGNIKVERAEDLILQEKALTEAILLKQGTAASAVRYSHSRESSGERTLTRSLNASVNGSVASDHDMEGSSSSDELERTQHVAFERPVDGTLALCPSEPFMPVLGGHEEDPFEPSISSHNIPVHAYVSTPDVQPTYEEILAEIKARKKSTSRSRNPSLTPNLISPNLKQRRNKIKRRTATPAAANEDSLANRIPANEASTSGAEDTAKITSSAPMELPDMQPFALRGIPPSPPGLDSTQKDKWYKKGWFRRRTVSDPPTSQAKIAENSELHFNRYYRIGELNGTKVMLRIRPTFASNRMDFGFKIKILEEEERTASPSSQQQNA